MIKIFIFGFCVMLISCVCFVYGLYCGSELDNYKSSKYQEKEEK